MFGMAEGGIDTAYMYKGFSEIAKLGAPAFAMIHAEDPALFEFLTPPGYERKYKQLYQGIS